MRALLVVAAILLAGCAENESAPTQQATELPGYLADALGPSAEIAPAGEAAWTVLDAVAGPQSPILAYSWILDAEAIVESVDYTGEVTAVLEMAAILPEVSEIEAIAIQAFVETTEGLIPVGGFYCPTLHFVTQTADGQIEQRTRAPPMMPVLVKLGIGLVEAGQTIHLVIATTANQTVEWGLAFRTLPADLPFGDQVPDAESFLQVVEGAPQLLKAQAQGAGLEMAAYLDYVAGAARVRVSSDFVDIQDRDPLPDLTAEARFDRALSAGLDSDGGYASVFGLFEGGAGSGEWSLAGDLRGMPLEASGQYSNANPTSIPLPVDAMASSPLLMAQADGVGQSATTFDLSLTAAGEKATLFFFQADLGTSITELTQLPVSTPGLTDGSGFASIANGCLAQAGGPGLPTLIAEMGC